MKKKSKRGFEKLIGKTIKKIDARAINCVYVECTDDSVFEINAEESYLRIPIIALDKLLTPKSFIRS